MDFVLGPGEVAVEVKGTSRVDDRELRSLHAFVDEHKPRKAIVVSNERVERKAGDLRIMPWRDFLRDLWAGQILR